MNEPQSPPPLSEPAAPATSLVSRMTNVFAAPGEVFDEVMHANVFGAMQLIPLIAPRLIKNKGTFAFVSSRMGSIAGMSGPNGPINYSIETGAPGVLRAHGWKFNTLKPGDKVVATVHPLKGDRVGGGLVSISKDGVLIGDAKPSPGYEGSK